MVKVNGKEEDALTRQFQGLGFWVSVGRTSMTTELAIPCLLSCPRHTWGKKAGAEQAPRESCQLLISSHKIQLWLRCPRLSMTL